MSTVTAVALVCSLKPSTEPSSSETIARHLADNWAPLGVETSFVRVADHDVRPGVQIDMGDGDEWPQIRAQVAAADIILIATPTWMGHMSSIAQRVLERLDAELEETDSQDRPGLVGRVGCVAVVGNEDGAHKIIADTFQALNDVGCSIPAQGSTYGNDEAMGGRDYEDLPEVPKPVQSTTATVARNAVHLARALRAENYPAYS